MRQRIQSNVQEIRQRIDDAAKRSGRQGSDITLVAVTKYVDAETTQAVFEAGCHDLGESRPQLLWEKASVLGDLSIQWHLIGHLQRNKVKKTVPHVSMIHSADSLRLIQAIQQASAASQQTTDILLEVNVSGESAKHGFDAQDIDTMQLCLDEVATMPNIRVCGMMAMAGLTGNDNDARREFAALRTLRDQMMVRGTADHVSLDQLSMGMSGDFEIAVEEGSTLVRVGSAIFDGI